MPIILFGFNINQKLTLFLCYCYFSPSGFFFSQVLPLKVSPQNNHITVWDTMHILNTCTYNTHNYFGYYFVYHVTKPYFSSACVRH